MDNTGGDDYRYARKVESQIEKMREVKYVGMSVEGEEG